MTLDQMLCSKIGNPQLVFETAQQDVFLTSPWLAIWGATFFSLHSYTTNSAEFTPHSSTESPQSYLPVPDKVHLLRKSDNFSYFWCWHYYSAFSLSCMKSVVLLWVHYEWLEAILILKREIVSTGRLEFVLISFFHFLSFCKSPTSNPNVLAVFLWNCCHE